MPKTLGAYVTAHKADARYAAAFIVEIERRVVGGASVFYRFTSHTRPLTYTGAAAANTPATGAAFAKQAFTLSTLSADEHGNAALQVDFDDENQTLKAIGLLYDFLDYPMKIWEAWLDASDGILDVYPLTYGRCDGMEASESDGKSTVTIVCEPDDTSLQTIGPSQEYDPHCPFIYKGAECQATSPLTFCDHNFAACVERGNSPRFGGCRYALAGGTVITFIFNTEQLDNRTYQPVDDRGDF